MHLADIYGHMYISNYKKDRVIDSDVDIDIEIYVSKYI